MKRKILLSVTLSLIIFTMNLSAQLVSSKSAFLLNLDYSRFEYDNQNGFLEIYYSFYPKHVTYNYSDNTFQGGVILSTKIIDTKTNQFVLNDKSTLKISEKDTTGIWYQFPFISKNAYAVPNGEYILQVLAIDSLESSRVDSIKLKIQIEPYASKITSSDIELCKNIISSKDENNLFYKNSLEVVPYPSLIFGSTTAPIMYHYAEIYNLNVAQNYFVRTEILNSKGTSIRQVTKPKKFSSENSIEIGTTPITSYSSGKYIFRLSVLNDKQDEILKTDKTFYIYNPHVELALSEKEKDKFINMSDSEVDEEFKYAKYIATGQEIKIFNGLDSYEAKAEFLFEFWKKVALGRGDFPPILRASYLARIEKAKSKYKVMQKEGWESDQGRVFIIYAEPDEIERVPSEAGTKPYEIWRYYGIEGGVEFIFANRTGSAGALELVHSTKRGELRDENWQFFIK